MRHGKTVGLIFLAIAPVLAAQQALQSRPHQLQPAVAALAPITNSQPVPVVPSAPAGAPGIPAGSHDSAAAVDYSSGQLTLVSDGAPLGYVMKLIARKTGAFVDLAPELQNEPVVARLGPGSVREVLTGLLDSPRIDYIVLGTGDEAGSLKRIVVHSRHSGVTMANIRAAQARQNAANQGESGVSEDGAQLSGQLSQEQLMENWRKVREEKRLAEIQQQAQDRENERNQVEQPPVPENPPQAIPQENPRNDSCCVGF